jgi:flagellar basal-body rod modification protein FlgD
MDVSAATNSTATTAPVVAEKPKAAITSDFETFLKMLTAQLQNQDPTNPMDSAEFAVQLATFSGVEQQVKSNDLLNSLLARLNESSLSEIAGWVGMEAKAMAPAYFYGEPVDIWPDPDSEANKVEIVAKNASGDEVGRYPIPNSTEPVTWAGAADDDTLLPDGLYTFYVESFKGSELLSTKQAEVYSLVTEARMVNGTPTLVLLGNKSFPASAISSIRNQPQ